MSCFGEGCGERLISTAMFHLITRSFLCKVFREIPTVSEMSSLLPNRENSETHRLNFIQQPVYQIQYIGRVTIRVKDTQMEIYTTSIEYYEGILSGSRLRLLSTRYFS